MHGRVAACIRLYVLRHDADLRRCHSGGVQPAMRRGRRLDLYVDELLSLRDAIAADSTDLKERFEHARTLHQDWLAGRAQGHTAEGDNPLPTTRSMLTGSLFGRFGRSDKP